ncbi:MAG: hypothetical protein HC795_11710 [Coleofasciculaceae cyanobacterium RL_1_1]|nr:hypothetical protein [Coleofasciculaceae cyanobacterium RL_1_1]
MVLADVLEAARQLSPSERQVLAQTLLDDLEEREVERPSLAGLFAKLREVCEEEDYELEIPSRVDRDPQFWVEE